MILRAWQLWRAATLDENTTRAVIGVLAGIFLGGLGMAVAGGFRPIGALAAVGFFLVIAFMLPAIAESLARFSDGVVRQAEAKHGKAAK